MIDRAWYDDYLAQYQRALFDTDVYEQCSRFRDLARSVKDAGGKLIFAGNGAGAAIASHASVDFTKQAEVTAVNFNEADLITCFANDFGYDQWVAKAIECYAKPRDAVVLISSSGKSANIVTAADAVRRLGLQLVTLSGFAKDNPIRSRGDINFWLDSRAYNVIECTHMIWITMVIDMVIGRADYPVSEESE